MRKQEQWLAGIYLVFQLLILPVVLVLVNRLLPTPLNEARLNFVFFLLNFLIVVLICHRYLLDSLRAARRKGNRLLEAVVLMVPGYYMASMVIGAVIMYVMPTFFNVNDSTIAGLASEDLPLTVIGTVILVPLAEETLYRGLIFGSLYRRNRVAAYVVSTLVFAAVHVVGYIGLYPPAQLLLCILQYLPAGICLGWAYQHAGTLVAPIVIHTIINTLGILLVR